MSDVPRSSDPLSSPRRLASLAATRLMDTDKDEVFDRLTRLASNVLGVPVAAMTLLDAERQFIKSAVGMGDAREAPVESSLCQHAVRSREPFIVEDAREHPLVKESSFVASGFLAYAGIPISVDDGEAVGAFCVVDQRPRMWTARELEILKDLSAAVESQIAAHRSTIEAEQRRQLLETVIDTMGSGLIVLDAERNVSVVNADAKRMFDEKVLAGAPHERAPKLGLFTANGVAQFLPEELPLMRAARGEVVENLDAVVRPPGQPGREIRVNLTARPLPDGGAVLVLHDVTEQRALERTARRNEALYLKLANNIPNALIYMIDPSWTILLAEGLLFRTLGANSADFVGKKLSEVVVAENWPQTEVAFRASLGGKAARYSATRGERTFEAHTQPLYEGTEVAGAIAVIFDVTERANEADALRMLTARLTALLEHMSEGVVFEDEQLRVQVVNRAALDMFNVGDPQQLLGSDLVAPASLSNPVAAPRPRDSFSEPALASYDIAEKRRRGERVLGERIEMGDGRIIERDFLPVLDNNVHRGNLWMHRDVTERERTAARLSELSVRDELTGLFNRRGFIQRGQKMLDAAMRTSGAPILFFVDLNGMKPINDQMGHHEGDRALVDTARLLEKAFAEGDIVARLGGDEFVVLIGEPGLKSPSSLERRLKNAVNEFNDGCTRLYRLSVSVGHTVFEPHAPRTIEQLLSAADAKMYAAKRARQDRGNVSLPPPKSIG